MEGLEVGAFFLQFLDWFYSSDRSSALATANTASAIPPAPHQVSKGTPVQGVGASGAPCIPKGMDSFGLLCWCKLG